MKFQSSLLACDDFRIDENGMPIITGVYTPVVLANFDEGEPDPFWLITMVTAPYDVDGFKAELSLVFERPGHEKVTRSMSADVKRPDDIMKDEPWTCVLPEHLRRFKFYDRMRMTVELNTGFSESHMSQLFVRSAFPEDDD